MKISKLILSVILIIALFVGCSEKKATDDIASTPTENVDTPDVSPSPELTPTPTQEDKKPEPVMPEPWTAPERTAPDFVVELDGSGFTKTFKSGDMEYILTGTQRTGDDEIKYLDLEVTYACNFGENSMGDMLEFKYDILSSYKNLAFSEPTPNTSDGQMLPNPAMLRGGTGRKEAVATRTYELPEDGGSIFIQLSDIRYYAMSSYTDFDSNQYTSNIVDNAVEFTVYGGSEHSVSSYGPSAKLISPSGEALGNICTMAKCEPIDGGIFAGTFAFSTKDTEIPDGCTLRIYGCDWYRTPVVFEVVS